MKVYVAFVLLIVVMSSCRAGKKASAFKLDDIKKEMTFDDVKKIAGSPTAEEDMGTATSENGDTTHIVTWRYGNNESVTFVNGKVNDVDTDIDATQKRLEHIMDSAKNVQPH